MNRLKNKLLHLSEKTETFGPIYEGEILVRPAECLGKNCSACKSDPCHIYADHEPIYWHNNTIGFAFSVTHKLAQDMPTVVIAIPADTLFGDPAPNSPLARLAAEVHAADAIAAARLAENLPSEAGQLASPLAIAAADHCLRSLRPVIDELNAPLYNRKRTDAENGKYIADDPHSIVCLRNSAYFACFHPKWYRSLTGATVQELPGAHPPKQHLCIRIQVQLPFHKLKQTMRMLCRDLPEAIEVWLADFERTAIESALDLAETQQAIA